MLGGAMGTVSLILIAGSLVLMFFVVLSGVKRTTPLDKTYFLRATTSGVQGARPVSQWNYFYVCGEGNNDCGSPVPALPFGYAWVGGGEGAPSGLLGYVANDFRGRTITNEMQISRKRHHFKVLLLHVALRMGVLPHCSCL
jgi:hypothetical protein